MTNKVKYEWANEVIEDNEISECDFTDTLAEIRKEDFLNNDIALVRNEGNENEGLIDRQWAYIKNGILPDYFSGANGQTKITVPQRFHKELTTYKNTQDATISK